MRGMARTAADTEDEQAPAALAHRGKAVGDLIDGRGVDRVGEVRRGGQVDGAVIAAFSSAFHEVASRGKGAGARNRLQRLRDVPQGVRAMAFGPMRVHLARRRTAVVS